MIRSFKCKETRKIWERQFSKKIPENIHERAYMKLLMIHNSRSLIDLSRAPSNRLEALRGNRKGQHSIRINDQYRICFKWNGLDAENVEIVDYH